MKRALVAACLLLACAGPARPPEPAPPRVTSPVASSAPSPAASHAPLSAKAPPPTLLITEPAVLAALERQGLTLAASFGAEASDNATLAKAPRFAPLVRELESELRAAVARDPLAGVDVARYSHRLFDARFLRLARARFALAGVVSRPDRAPFGTDSCGETRLIYRLEYDLGGERASKLPMTLGVELEVPREPNGCAVAAARWREPATTQADDRARYLRSEGGPLSPSLVALSGGRARVVVNVQLVRWPSTVRPDLGGHAEYLLRAFRPNPEGVLSPDRLENTVDPTSLASAAKRGDLRRWLEENAAAVDAGTARLPESMLALRAVSVTPRGLSRLANRPFSAALTERDLAGRDFAAGGRIKTAAGLLRRLDQLSCQGCHEARSVAGFHLLGADSASAAAENALALPVSPQVLADLPRRQRIAEHMLAGASPDFSAPFAEHASGEGRYGAACGLTSDATFSDWTCAPGLRCSRIEAGEAGLVGQCLPPAPQVGDACERASVRPHADARRDRVGAVELQSCADMVCNRSAVGFPGGMCTADCSSPGAACGAIAILDSFNACLARGEGFLRCIRGNTSPAGLRACDAGNPCRDDYVCARGRENGAESGVCLPPYFVFQLRVDGHSSALGRP